MEQKIAVLLPVYKNDLAEWFESAISSVANQFGAYILIGVDGPIGGDLSAMVAKWEDVENVKVYYYAENRGLACVLNDLLDVALDNGFEFIARMDADDISMQDRFARQIAFLEQHPDIDVVGGTIEEIDEQGKNRGKTVSYPETPIECKKFFAKRNPHAHPAVLFRKSFFNKLDGEKYRPEYRQNQDTMLWFDGMMHGTLHANIPDVVLKFRVTDAMFKKRRNGWAFAKKQFEDRLIINRGLGFGIMADIYGFAMFCLLIAPVWIKKFAYKMLR
jgi:glycosyltransferase involved in cell wall biosynthesis